MPRCFLAAERGATRACPFGGDAQRYKNFSQQFAYASSESPTLQQGNGCAGDTADDPIGATFDEVYNGAYYYVVWNDQFYDDPDIKGCSESCGAPGVTRRAWWPGTMPATVWSCRSRRPRGRPRAAREFPRKTDGNTLGCVKDNDVQVSQHFFALRLTKDDLVQGPDGANNASVVTDPSNPQIVNNGGPADVQKLVATLGVKSASQAPR